MTNGPRRTETRDLVLFIVGLVPAECEFLRVRRKFLRADPRGQIMKQHSTTANNDLRASQRQQRVREVDFGGGT